jgi:CRISP-associated protein Cas1
MSKNYYVLSNGRLQRESNGLTVVNAMGQKRAVPIEDVESLYIYGEVDINTKLLNFLSQKRITLHVFNYYGFYSGSYYPREYLNSGYLLVKQVEAYQDSGRRLQLCQELVRGAAHSILRNISYYSNRKQSGAQADETDMPRGEVATADNADTSPYHPKSEEAEAAVDGAAIDTNLEAMEDTDPLACDVDLLPDDMPDLQQLRTTIEAIVPLISTQLEVNSLRGIEGKIRERYYQSWAHILTDGWTFTKRVRRPPDNEVNALISFGNSMLYTICLAEIYRTQLNPIISYLHEPGTRRFSLALDVSEIFKPIIVDRVIFKLLNTGQLRPEHFDRTLDGCYLAEDGRKIFLAELETKLASTIKHRRLSRHVSYRHLIRLECYKLVRALTGVEEYRAFRAWW